MAEYVLDTYAIIEYLKGNGSYVELINNASSLYVTQMNLMELYYISLRENGEELAEKHFEAFVNYEIGVSETTLKSAMKLRLTLKKEKKDLSYTNVLGLQLARDRKMEFLTGDKELRGLENVKFMR